MLAYCKVSRPSKVQKDGVAFAPMSGQVFGCAPNKAVQKNGDVIVCYV